MEHTLTTAEEKKKKWGRERGGRKVGHKIGTKKQGQNGTNTFQKSPCKETNSPKALRILSECRQLGDRNLQRIGADREEIEDAQWQKKRDGK